MHDMIDYEIRQVLAELYDSHEKANLAARDIDLQLGRIAYSPAMETYWGNIWIEANSQHKELDLIERVQRDYPRNERIAQIHAHITHMQTKKLPPPPSPVVDLKREEDKPNRPPRIRPPRIKALISTILSRIKLPRIKTLISIILYIAAVLLLLLDIFPLFNILGPMIFLKKLMQRNLANLLLIAGGVVVVAILAAIVYDLISIPRKKLDSQPSSVWYRKAPIYGTMIAICLIAICIPLFWYYILQTGVEFTSDNSRIGVCDGSCILDGDRSTRMLKQEAANYFQQKQDALACQYLRWAALGDITGPETTNPEQNDARSQAEDTTDAEAKIDYENRCTNTMHCPCISFVVVVQFIDQNAPNADYVNGMSRSILQGAYLQQKKWNRSHLNGPGMYLFIANVSPDVPGEQQPEPTQQEVANQIMRIQQSDQDHIVVGVVGLPFGTNTLTNKLNDAHIPMVSIAPLVSSNSQPYLFSVSPSLDDEINNVIKFCSRFQKIQYYYAGNDDYSQAFTQLFQTSPNSPSSVNPIPYQNITSLANQIAASDSDLVIFIGPVGDTANFLIQLRTAEKANNYKSHTVLTGDDFYQWVYKYFTPDQRTAFDNIRFVAFAYPDPTLLHNDSHVLDDFNNTSDPGGKRSGNIYTYGRASSDAILAYDALSLFANAQNNTTCTTSCDASAWGETLQRYIRSNSFKGTSGQISFTSGGSTPDSKFLFFLVIQDQKNGNPQDFSGRY